MSKILLLNGPNLNLLGTREPEIYGTTTLDEIEKKLSSSAIDAGHEFLSKQTNAEHEMIDFIQDAKSNNVDVIIVNPGPLTHTSIALRDTFLSTGIPFIEVHISNTKSREDFRKQSFISPNAKGVIQGFGLYSYDLAILSFLSS